MNRTAYLGGRDTSGSRHLPGEEAAKVVGGLDDSTVPCDIGHAAEHVKSLQAEKKETGEPGEEDIQPTLTHPHTSASQ